jgi:hypothetical protein
VTTPLSGALKREITAHGSVYTVTLTQLGLKLVPKGKRNGVELTWASLVDGEAALATALNASLHALPEEKPRTGVGKRAAR